MSDQKPASEPMLLFLERSEASVTRTKASLPRAIKKPRLRNRSASSSGTLMADSVKYLIDCYICHSFLNCNGFVAFQVYDTNNGEPEKFSTLI